MQKQLVFKIVIHVLYMICLHYIVKLYNIGVLHII